MKIKAITLGLVTLLDLAAHGQGALQRDPYSIDKQMELSMKKFRLVDPGRLENSMKIRVASEKFLFFDTYERDKPLDCFTKSYLAHDTIYVIGHMIGELGWGFQMAIYKDSCVVAPFALSDGKIYKYNKLDTDSVDFVLLQSVTRKMVLSKRPSFKEGETVAGLVELKSVPFYYTVFDDEFVIDLQAYFKTAPLRRSQ